MWNQRPQKKTKNKKENNMKQKDIPKIWLLYGSLLLFNLLPCYGNAQSIKRQCISCYGTVISTENHVISQTVGQCYNTLNNSENNSTVLQGFQQSGTFLIQTVESPTFEDLDISVYPNPSSYSFTIESNQQIEQSYIKVMNINGKYILSEEVKNLQNHTINCETWTNGVYLITIYDGYKNNKTLRLIISK